MYLELFLYRIYHIATSRLLVTTIELTQLLIEYYICILVFTHVPSTTQPPILQHNGNHKLQHDRNSFKNHTPNPNTKIFSFTQKLLISTK